MNLGEFLSIIRDNSISIIVIAEQGINGVAEGTKLYSGAIGDFINTLVDADNDVYLDELYIDIIDVDSYGDGMDYGIFTIYVY